MEVVEILKDCISTIGFPIVAYLLMFRQNRELSATVTENTKAINDLRETLITKNE